MVPANAQHVDQPNWHPSWLAYTEFDGRTVVLHTYVPGVFYVCRGTTQYPALRTVFVGPSEDVARVYYNSFCNIIREEAQ